MEPDVRRHAQRSRVHHDRRAATIKPSLDKIALALSSRRDNHLLAATAKMAILIVAAFPSRLSRYSSKRFDNVANAPISETGASLARVVQGYLNYHAVPGNLKRLGMYRAEGLQGMAALAPATELARTHDLGSVPALRWAIHPESPRLSSASKSKVRVMTQGRSRMR